jgi:glycosyltransferase involved in cell wall biosynthesis
MGAKMKQGMPLISIVTPSFKSRATIEDTILSVISQNYPRLEYIVIDGAGDNTADILNKYSSKISYWHSRPDSGQYDAINQGFSIANGDIMSWINADDMLLPRSLFVVGSIFQTFGDVQWISTLRPVFWDADGCFAYTLVTPGFSRDAFLDGLYLPTTKSKGHWIQQESTFFRRSLWEDCGSSFSNYPLAGDFALWSEFYKYSDLYGVDYPLAGFRFLEGQRSENKFQYIKEANDALNNLRTELNWVEANSNRLIYSSLSQVPKIRGILRKKYGYSGNCIYKTSLEKPNAAWAIRSYRFLP